MFGEIKKSIKTCRKGVILFGIMISSSLASLTLNSIILVFKFNVHVDIELKIFSDLHHLIST